MNTDLNQAKSNLNIKPYYLNEVFPKIKESKTVFNWRSMLFGWAWYPLKGLWLEWAKYVGVVTILSAVMNGLKPMLDTKVLSVPMFFTFLGILMLAVFGFVIFMGFTANKKYYEVYSEKSEKNEKLFDGWKSGVAGTFMYMAIGGILNLTVGQLVAGSGTLIKESAQEAQAPLKSDIDAIDLGMGTVAEVIPNLAGARGRVTWTTAGNDTFITITKKSGISFMKFTLNPDTQYILLTAVVANGKECSGEDSPLIQHQMCLNRIAVLK